MAKKVKWGIIGLGNIARNFVKDLALVNDAQIYAAASRNLDKAKGFAEEYKIPNAYGSYKELLECKEVDVVYIATPHTSHCELSIMAMEHGKHVLCEKPMGINRAEVEKMLAAAKQNKVFLMEALWSRFNPSIKKAKQLIDNGEIGPLAYIHADFAFYALDRDLKGRVLNPELAGGSLLDIGIYPIFLAYLLLGKPDQILSSSNFHDNGTEIQTSMIFKYPKAQAILYSGFTSHSEMKAEISGERGTIYIPTRWHEAQGYTVERNGEKEDFSIPTTGRGYYYEIKEVHDCLEQGKLESSQWSHSNSLDLITLMDTVRKQNGIAFPFEE
ncbi:Gfo/Idh/MocA family protein [Arenibacter sp. ARW7G5Y1]|uniref:Gfo/Idh/MocA family protein n=1 Tax=Arenibacter sp. ARW7G5Y1 TaxID=2135619 RepID=UPI000D757F05|nr:Gfo/Idh/MocA family oxidoreductase [Arenibacter sp. ARW7G5Y1]PXX25590.1 putative dehydrogenase [Arenibacter sp. ARW7G5Y1]|tara:strand:+ start:23217 stop:24200 length:984 start_codon:yes stop_codon:yes gene_type:complete